MATPTGARIELVRRAATCLARADQGAAAAAAWLQLGEEEQTVRSLLWLLASGDYAGPAELDLAWLAAPLQVRRLHQVRGTDGCEIDAGIPGRAGTLHWSAAGMAWLGRRSAALEPHSDAWEAVWAWAESLLPSAVPAAARRGARRFPALPSVSQQLSLFGK